MANPFDDICDRCSLVLQTVAVTSKLKREVAGNTSPGVYYWIPVGGPLVGTNKSGANQIDSMSLSVDIHCWGSADQSATAFSSDFDAAWHLFSALIKTIRQVVKGRNYTVGNVVIDKPDFIEYGIAIIVPVTFHVAVLDVDIPLVGTRGAIVDHVDTTLTPPVLFAEATPALSVPGDGILEGREA